MFLFFFSFFFFFILLELAVVDFFFFIKLKKTVTPSGRSLSPYQATFEQKGSKVDRIPGGFSFFMHHTPGKANPADALPRQSMDTESELNDPEFSIDLGPDLAKTDTDGYADDPELRYIIKKLANFREDAFYNKYFWDASKRRL